MKKVLTVAALLLAVLLTSNQVVSAEEVNLTFADVFITKGDYLSPGAYSEATLQGNNFSLFNAQVELYSPGPFNGYNVGVPLYTVYLGAGRATYNGFSTGVTEGGIRFTGPTEFTSGVNIPVQYRGTVSGYASYFDAIDRRPPVFTVTFSGTMFAYAEVGGFGRTYRNRITFGTVPFTPVPEPASMILAGTGLASLIGLARRRARWQ